MTNIRFLLAASLLVFASPRAWALSSYAGTSGAPFLKLGAGARAGAMAEAFSAVADDASALYYNPAGLTLLRRPELAGAHTQHFQGISYEYAGFVYPLKSKQEYSRHALGLGIYNLSVGDMERRTGDTLEAEGSFGAGDYAYNLSYAYRVDETLGVGATGKIIHQTLDTYSSMAYALDAGVHYSPRPTAKRPVTFALVLKNAGTRPSFAGVSDPLPLAVTAGVGFEPLRNRVKLDLDLSKYRDTDFFAAFGGEYRHPFSKELSGAFRFGYTSVRKDNEGLNGLAMGVGVMFLQRFGFDFAWVPYGVLGDTFRYSINLKF
ncbi:MAG: PorV/PorQ family protein [Elusimicrobia bacterium]|nr:PorV/PorQ family protein [Elusimicrobiota bacterium]